MESNLHLAQGVIGWIIVYEIRVEVSFPASHQVSLVGGEPEPLHEHIWTVQAKLAGQKLSPDGILADFAIVKQLLEEIADKLKGQDLGQTTVLADQNPSAENVARYFYDQLQGQIGPAARLIGVAVQEAPGCWASYRP